MIPRLRCVTLNVLGPANPDWERRSLLIKDVLGRLGADVVALQEVRVGDVEQLLGPGCQVTPSSSASEDGTGGVLATRGRRDVLLQVLRCDRLLGRPVGGVWASDHYGVVADLAVPRHPPGTWGEVS